MPPKRERIHYRIREYRLRQGMTQAQLAAAVGCTESFVSQLERQASAPSDVILVKIAQKLGVSIESLIDDSSAPAKTRAVE